MDEPRKGLPRRHQPKAAGNPALPSNMVDMVSMVFQPPRKTDDFPRGCKHHADHADHVAGAVEAVVLGESTQFCG